MYHGQVSHRVAAQGLKRFAHPAWAGVANLKGLQMVLGCLGVSAQLNQLPSCSCCSAVLLQACARSWLPSFFLTTCKVRHHANDKYGPLDFCDEVQVVIDSGESIRSAPGTGCHRLPLVQPILSQKKVAWIGCREYELMRQCSNPQDCTRAFAAAEGPTRTCVVEACLQEKS